jgi:hypothetical protein
MLAKTKMTMPTSKPLFMNLLLEKQNFVKKCFVRKR